MRQIILTPVASKRQYGVLASSSLPLVIILQRNAVLSTRLRIILAVIGTYGLVAYLVAQRTQELGVRLALGANSIDILWLVLRYGLSIGLAGVPLGTVGSLLMRQSFARLLYGLTASDPLTLVAAAILLLLIVVTASAVPAAAAMRIDAVQALRSE
jgi:ABC-type antimicrobial peptide transport system permease subunit